MEGSVVMALLGELMEEQGEQYILATVEAREESGKAVDYEMLAYCDDYESAVASRKIVLADGVATDMIIIPPFNSREIPPKEMAELRRTVYGWDLKVSEPQSIVWYLSGVNTGSREEE